MEEDHGVLPYTGSVCGVIAASHAGCSPRHLMLGAVYMSACPAHVFQAGTDGVTELVLPATASSENI